MMTHNEGGGRYFGGVREKRGHALVRMSHILRLPSAEAETRWFSFISLQLQSYSP